jgi:hypothetical protein
MFPDLITDLLQEGHKVSFDAPGHSMFPTIMANETIMVEPIDPAAVKQGDIILYRSNNHLIAHRVVKIDKNNDSAIAETPVRGDSPLFKRSARQAQRSSSAAIRFVLQGDASCSCDAPMDAGQILGKVVSIERNGFSIDPYSFMHKIGCLAICWGARIKKLPRWIFSSFFPSGR